MQVILLERIGRLGQMGDVVNVKDGYARNFLLPQKKALRATEDNLARFEGQRAQLEARDLELKKEAEAVSGKLQGKTFLAIRQAGDTGQLYGSVTSRDLAEVITAGGIVGKVTKATAKEDTEVTVEIADGVQVKVVKATLTEVRAKGQPVETKAS